MEIYLADLMSLTNDIIDNIGYKGSELSLSDCVYDKDYSLAVLSLLSFLGEHKKEYIDFLQTFKNEVMIITDDNLCDHIYDEIERAKI